MKIFGKLVLIAVFLLTLPLAVSAMDHSKMDMDHKDHGSMNHGDHGKMDMDHSKMSGGMLMLGNDSEEGVTAMAHVKVYDEAARASMAKMGMTSTHHLMVVFTDEKSGDPIVSGTVAVKVKSGDGEVGDAIMLMPMKMDMGSGFGADVTLPAGDEYEFKLGTKLADGKKRKFEFEYKVK